MKIGFIGAGQMARALASGFARSRDVQQIIAADPVDDAIKEIGTLVAGHAEFSAAKSNQQVVDECSLIVVAVKPQYVAAALAEIKLAADAQEGGPIFLSVVAGVEVETLRQLLGTDRIVRCMPNTPCLVGAGAIGVTQSDVLSQAEHDRIIDLLKSVGAVVEVPERLLNGVTALSGSGPAFVFTFLEAMIDGGVLAGLPRDQATLLAKATIGGSLKLLQQSGEHPAVLRERVTSPAGTTAYGLAELEAGGLRATVISAIEAATCRAETLADQNRETGSS